jgi:hypothetical protein
MISALSEEAFEAGAVNKENIMVKICLYFDGC